MGKRGRGQPLGNAPSKFHTQRRERRDKAKCPKSTFFLPPISDLIHIPPHTYTRPPQATQELKEKARDDAKAAAAAGGGAAPVEESVDGVAEAVPTAEGPVAETSAAAKAEVAPAVPPVVPPAVVAVAAPEATAPATDAAAGLLSTLSPAAAAADASGAVATVDAAAAAAAALQTAKHTALDFNAEEKPLSTFMLVRGGVRGAEGRELRGGKGRGGGRSEWTRRQRGEWGPAAPPDPPPFSAGS